MKSPKIGQIGHLSTRRRWNVYIASMGVWLTGAAWIVFHYFLKTTDKYGFAKPHPGEHYTLIAHAAFGFLAIWLFGVLWPGHVKRSWRAHIRRESGGTLFGFTLWLILSGFLLYYLGGEEWRRATSLVHWGSGLAAVIPFAVHLLTRTSRKETVIDG